MGRGDLLQLAVGFVWVGLIALIAILFPVYGVYQNLMSEGKTYVRCPIWDPPNLYTKPLDLLDGADKAARFDAGADLADRVDVDPPNMKASPIFLDTRMRLFWGERRNGFGTCAAYLVVVYFMFAIWKWNWRG